MLTTILIVTLAWTLIGSVAALWLAAEDYQCSNREAGILAVVCGPTLWLFVLSCFVVCWVQRVRGR